MLDPFRMMSDWIRAGRMIGETLDAAHDVVAHRHAKIATAAADPIGADMSELTLMVVEKAPAFAKAGSTLAADWAAMQSDLWRQTTAIQGMMLSGRVPSLATAGSILDRGARINQRALASGLRALKPIHAAATANQRRLKRR